MIKRGLMLLAFLPLGWQMPYLMQAWGGSRLDRWDWVFYLLSIPAALGAVRQEKPGEKYEYRALWVLIPMLTAAALPGLHHINALSVAAGAMVIWAMAWLLYSWHFASRVLPAAVILLLGTPSSSYHLSLLLMCPVWLAWIVKFVLAGLCLGWIWCNRRFDLQVRCGTVCFLAAALVSCLLWRHTEELYFEGSSFIPEFPPHVGEFWGRRIQTDENTRRFFATSNVAQYRYTKNDTDISVLAVRCGRDIHEIHPASHCLRTSMWTVNSEEIFYLQNNFAVTEIDACKNDYHCLVWVWFSGDDFSTPGFLGFRRKFRPGGNYYTYQISIPVYENIEKSRNELKNFIESLKHERVQ